MTMTRTVARYTVKPGSEERNAELVRAVYRELAELAPQGPPSAWRMAGPSSTSLSRMAMETVPCGN
jgi:hypothetical protein